MSKPQIRQDYLFDILRNEPALSYSAGFGRYTAKFGKSERTFDKDWKKAQGRLKEYLQVINKAKMNESIKQETKAVKRKILEKLEALELLSEIVTDESKTTTERINAVKELAKIQGWYEPERIETTTSTQKIIFELVEQPLFSDDVELVNGAK